MGWAGEVDEGEIHTDINRPFYDPARWYFDMWASYRFKINDKLRAKVQLNVRDLFEDGGLRAIRFNPDGTPSTFRIVNPRSFFLTTSLEF